MRYFGKPWNSFISSLEGGPTPIGKPCNWCKESIQEGELGLLIPSWPEGEEHPVHQECFLREVLGSVGHQQKRCSCFGGTEEDPPGMTKREAAKAAVDFYYREHRNEFSETLQ